MTCSRPKSKSKLLRLKRYSQSDFRSSSTILRLYTVCPYIYLDLEIALFVNLQTHIGMLYATEARNTNKAWENGAEDHSGSMGKRSGLFSVARWPDVPQKCSRSRSCTESQQKGQEKGGDFNNETYGYANAEGLGELHVYGPPR